MNTGSPHKWKLWMVAAAGAAVVLAGMFVVTPELLGMGDGTAGETVEETGEAGSSRDLAGMEETARTERAGAGTNVEIEAALTAVEVGPEGFRALLSRLISSGLMAEYGPEFTHLISGEPLRIANSCDLETFLAQLKAADKPEEIRAALAPLALALRDAIRNKDPEAADIQRQLGIALLFAAEQTADSGTLTPEQQLDRLVKIGGVLNAARIPELSLAMNDVAQDFLGVTDSPANRRNVDAVLRTRLDIAASMRDLQTFESAAQQWMEISKDQRDASVAARWRQYAQRLTTFPRESINSQGGATWPGLTELPASAIISIGTNWLKVPGGADRSRYVAARDGLVQQIDEIIRTRSGQASRAEEVRKLQEFRKKLATTRVR